MEQFSQGRSVAWYWRQVQVAILVGLVKEWRMLAWAAVVTVCWAFPFHYGRFGDKILTQYASSIERHRHWFLPLTYATARFTWLAFGPICFASAMCWVMTTDLTMKRRARKALLCPLKGYIAVALSSFLLLAFSPPAFGGNIIGLLPVFFGLVVTLWSVPPHKGTAKFFRIDPPSNWWIY